MTARCRPCFRCPRQRVDDPLTIVVAARDEEAAIGKTVDLLRRSFPAAEVIVADDGSRDSTAEVAEEAGAIVLRLTRRGKGQALTAGERAAPPGSLLLCDADLSGDLQALLEGDADLRIAAFEQRIGGGFGIAKRAARRLIALRSGFEAREPLSGQRALSPAARSACFPVAAGFGCEVRMTIDAARAGLRIVECELPLRHRATGRDLGGFVHRARQLVDAIYACGPLGINFRGLRLPLVGWKIGVTNGPAVAAVAALGLADDLWSGEERGFRAHLRSGRTTGMLKLVGIPAVGFLATRKLSGAVLVALAANALNQLDTKPGRALKVYLAAALPLRAPVGIAVLLLPYDLREMAMLGDAGSNALGALLGLNSVKRFTGRGQWVAIGALAGLTILGERTSIGAWIERTPGLSSIDRLGRA
jgi:Glycosyl transferase family 2